MTDENMKKAIELARKVKALATAGIAGEKDAAAKKLEVLMKKYKITINDIAGESLEMHRFTYKTAHKNLAHQIFYAVCPKRDVYTTNTARNMRVINCTLAEKIEILEKLDFYCSLYEQELDNFHTAFVSKHHIFPDASDKKDIPKKEYTAAEKLAILNMMAGMKSETFTKKIGNNEDI